MKIRDLSITIWLIFGLGIVLRLIIFGLNTCYIHDDAALAINVISKTYRELFQGLDFCQVAPPFFLVFSKFLYNFMPKNYEAIDIGLRIIPFVSSIISIPFFYVLSILFFNDKKKIYIANLLFTLNPLLVMLSGRFKQYSIEIFIGILLYIVIYNYLTTSKWKKNWNILIFLAPWLSLSSLIILFSGLIIVYLKNKCLKKDFYLPLVLSVIVFSIIFIPSNYEHNFASMNNFWSNYGFMSIIHPQRFLIRLGELFFHDYKMIESILGVLILYKLSEYLWKNKFNDKALLIIIPIFMTIILSCLHLYPFIDRLIAFLVPLFIIIMANYCDNNISKMLTIGFIITSLVASYFLVYKLYNMPNYRSNTVQYLNSDTVHEQYKPFYPVYKWYTHLN